MVATPISDLAVLRNQPDLFGEVASTLTAWRTLEAIDSDALARHRRGAGRRPRPGVGGGSRPGFYVIDFDGTLITTHSDKQGAAPTYKRASASIRCWPSWTPLAKRWLASCARAMPGPTPQP